MVLSDTYLVVYGRRVICFACGASTKSFIYIYWENFLWIKHVVFSKSTYQDRKNLPLQKLKQKLSVRNQWFFRNFAGDIKNTFSVFSTKKPGSRTSPAQPSPHLKSFAKWVAKQAKTLLKLNSFFFKQKVKNSSWKKKRKKHEKVIFFLPLFFFYIWKNPDFHKKKKTMAQMRLTGKQQEKKKIKNIGSV